MNMRIRFNLLAGNTFSRLAGVRALIEHADRSIPDMESRVLKDLQAHAENEGWDYGDFDVERQRLQADYRHSIPKFAGYSGVVLLCSVLETQLTACADQVAMDRGSAFRVKDIQGSSLGASVLLIEKISGITVAEDPAWPLIRDIQLLRNIIVHEGGAKGRSEKQQEKFTGILARRRGVSKSDEALSGEEFMVSQQFCLSSCDEIEQFFKRLFRKLNLPEEGITRLP
jgi:hypothetical protein